MPNIIKVQPDGKGGAWGFDSDSWKWMPIDPKAQEGSFVGNVGRAASRGFEGMGLGLEQLAGQDEPGAVESLQQRQGAAGAVAPWAEGVGGAVPDVLAGIGTGIATGGASIPVMLGAEMLSGAATGFARPGSIEERAKNAGINTLLAAGGVAIAPVVGSAMRAAFGVGRQITEGATAATAQGIEAGGIRLSARQAAAEGEAAAGQGGRSIGAAEVPEAQLGEEFAQQNKLLDATDEAGANIDNNYERAMRERAEAEGYTSPFGAGTRGMSPARLGEAVQQMNPLGGAARLAANNQKYIVKQLGEALGIEGRTSLMPADLGDAVSSMGDEFQKIEKMLPALEANKVAKSMAQIDPVKGLGERSRAGKYIDNIVKDAEAMGDGMVDVDTLTATRRKMNSEMAGFYAKGLTDDGEAMLRAISKIDDLIEKRLKQVKSPDQVMERWAKVRGRYRILKALGKHGVSPQGEVNVRTLRSGLMKDPSRGGFGFQRPEGASGKLWDAVHVMAQDETGVPMTGARLITAGRMAARGAGTAALGGIGLGGLNSLWD